MDLKEVLLTILSFLASTLIVVVFIAVGWYIIWVAFLSRFKLMRELLSIGDGSEKKKSEPSDSRNSSRSSPRKPIGKRSQPAR